jgi:hypothetical protein
MIAPGDQVFERVELDDRDALAVLGDIVLCRDQA